MELRHLRYFVAAAETENVSRAALKLHVSQPALSRQIRDLEDELGFPLFERGAKSMRLTDAGRTFLEGSRAVLDRASEAVAAARTVAQGNSTDLQIGYAMSPTVRILPLALRNFQARYPGVRVRLHDLSTEEMLTGLRAGKLQLAFLVCSRQALLRGLHSEALAKMPIHLAVAPQHRLARRRTVSLQEVAQLPLIAFTQTEYPDYHESLQSVFASARLKPRIAQEHESVGSLIAAVEAGSGVALVTESLACVAGPRLKLIKLSPAPPPFILAAAWPKSGLHPMAEAFYASAKAAAATPADSPTSSGSA